MSNEMSKEVLLKRKAIEEKISELSLQQLEEVDHLLSAYLKPATNGSVRDLPMHFYGRFTGLNLLDDGRVEMNLGLQNVNTYGVAQGGAIYTLADVSIGFMVLERLTSEEKVFTLEMKVNFIKKGAGTRLFATPKILSAGKTIIVAESMIEDEEGDVVAKALGTFFIARF